MIQNQTQIALVVDFTLTLQRWKPLDLEEKIQTIGVKDANAPEFHILNQKLIQYTVIQMTIIMSTPQVIG